MTGFFRTFPRRKKSAKIGRELSANLVSHSSSWPPAAYQEEEAGYDYHLAENDYSFDALQAYCFGINIKL